MVPATFLEPCLSSVYTGVNKSLKLQPIGVGHFHPLLDSGIIAARSGRAALIPQPHLLCGDLSLPSSVLGHTELAIWSLLEINLSYPEF